MDDLRVGLLFRAIRRRLHMRQVDVAQRADVDQKVVSDFERGRFDGHTLGRLRRVAVVLEIHMPFDPRWRGGALARLLDARHAAMVEQVARLLQLHSWIVIAEYTFNHFGERGAVDLVAWHPATRELLLVEVKTALFDVQDLLAQHHRRLRIVPTLLASERGWRATTVASVIVLPESTSARSAVRTHASTIRAVLANTSRDARRWIGRPLGPLHAVWFLTPRSGSPDKRAGGGAHRIRITREGHE